MELVPLSIADLEALTRAVPERYRALLVMAAGSGLRPGEAFGVSADRINFLKRELRVDRQVITLKGPPVLITGGPLLVGHGNPGSGRNQALKRIFG